ncbi:TPA: hypothetical protein ACPPAU_001028 [Haemophilus influenzae]|jgi:hypothetical protein|uniref:hypothetical protein n=1 Tax=Haemophilus influenzae TaxID=727 RepID=UPI000E0DA9C7|nr:hypothetical protein [Haemophilus influenzae]AXH82771.1 hypothetical protein DV389_03775 [Haemophilus influenzae]NKB30565.1 hypothetical protein [Haemophilus influenzae]
MNDLFISSAILIVLLLIALFGLKVMNIERTIGKIIVLFSLSVGYAFTLGDVLTFNNENMPVLNCIQLVYYSAISFFVFGFAGLFFSTKAGISENGLE